MVTLTLPYRQGELEGIRAGDEVVISGVLYVGRDQVHKRLYEAIASGKPLPFDFCGNGIYYMGPSPAPEGWPIGAAGPTTSARMDPYTPCLMEHGLRLAIGKGPRSEDVRLACQMTSSVYLQAYGGCGALYGRTVRKVEGVAYPELGPEAMIRLTVEDFPAICIIDSRGRLLGI